MVDCDSECSVGIDGFASDNVDDVCLVVCEILFERLQGCMKDDACVLVHVLDKKRSESLLHIVVVRLVCKNENSHCLERVRNG